MAKPSSENPRTKPGFVLSRKAVAGWVVVVFVISGWMFGTGVMVGRDTAPIRFDLDKLKKTLGALQKTERAPARGAPAADPAQMKDKTKLDFYEVLPKNRDDSDMPKLPKPAPAAPPAAKPEPAAPKAQEPPAAVKAEKPPAPAAPPPAPVAAAPGQVFTVQISAVKSEEEARRTTERLRQSGYAAHVEATSIPDKGTWYRVRMGEFPTRESARGTVERLKKDGFGSMVVPK
ncbi:MAG: SPOR domain-containing protein [Desulfobacterales bacterium]|jgi:cell division septation protein DedD|nr:SPOR domain-containing protein [Desulfobacterales bacterium]